MSKSFNQIMDDMFSGYMEKASVNDFAPGSVFKALLEADEIMQKQAKRISLLRFLAKLDSRFNKHLSPWAELEIAQRYFSKL